MSTIEKEVVLEALSALLGTPVKSGSKGMLDVELNIWNFLSTLLFGKPATDHVQAASDEGLCEEIFVDMDEFFDRKYDYDFRFCNDKSTCMRGDEPYKRPCGWYRVALKVLDKYPDGNVWLGTDGWRSNSVAGEWPVSYHGTTLEWAQGENRRGIYSTYDLDEASCYCTEFHSVKTGKNFRVIMQNRINPQMRTTCGRRKYWMIEVPPNSPPGVEREIVEKSLRSYGILLKEI